MWDPENKFLQDNTPKMGFNNNVLFWLTNFYKLFEERLFGTEFEGNS